MVTEFATEGTRPVSLLIDGPPMAEHYDDDQKHIIGNGIDDAVVTDTDSETGSTLQCTSGRWARVVRQ